MSTHETLGSSLLVSTRRAAGLTQEELAARSGISVRAVRLLETGATRAPRRSSLEVLASALGLDDEQTASFLRCWTQSRRVVSFRSISLNGVDTDTLLALHNAVNADSRDIAIVERMRVGADHRFVGNELTLVVEALDDQVPSRTFLWLDAPSVDASLIAMTPGQGCRVASRTVSTEHNLVAFEVAFPRPLGRGELFTFSLAVDIDRASHAPDTSEPDTFHTCGFRQHVELYSLEVDFEVPPGRVASVSLPHDGPARRRPLAVAGTSVQAVFRHLGSGNYGVEWEW